MIDRMVTQLKPGESWVPKSGNPGGFVVLKPEAKGEILVDVERRIPSKEAGEIKMETRRRSLTPKDVEFFVLGYERKKKSV
jgi:hypothetical protein